MMIKGSHFNRIAFKGLDPWHVARFGEKRALKYDKNLVNRYRRTKEKQMLLREQE